MEENAESQNAEQQPVEKKEKHKKEKIKGPGFFSKQKDKLVNYRRVISVARKPDKDEFTKAVKITGSGILTIGLIGFLIFLIYYAITSGVVL